MPGSLQAEGKSQDSTQGKRRRYTPRLPRAERGELILDATRRLVAREGWAGLKMDRVAAEAEIAKSVVYAIFESQEGLQHALMARERERAFALSARTLAELENAEDLVTGSIAALTRFLDGVAAEPDTWRLVLLPIQGAPPTVAEAILEGRERWRERIEPLVARLLGSENVGGLDLELVGHFVRGNAEYFARLILEEPDRFTPERIERFGADLGTRLLALSGDVPRSME